MIGREIKTLAQDVLAKARERGVTLATAESCTGGLLGAALTAIPGSSDVYERGFITYSNAAKRQMLGVAAGTLEAHGAVSESTAAEMASGALGRSGVQLAVSITGIAGPGGSDHKPEGRVCFGLATLGDVRARTVEFGPMGRDAVREASVRHALELMLDSLRN